MATQVKELSIANCFVKKFRFRFDQAASIWSVEFPRTVWKCLLAQHHLDKLVVVDLAIAVDIGLADHLVYLVV